MHVHDLMYEVKVYEINRITNESNKYVFLIRNTKILYESTYFENIENKNQ